LVANAAAKVLGASRVVSGVFASPPRAAETTMGAAMGPDGAEGKKGFWNSSGVLWAAGQPMLASTASALPGYPPKDDDCAPDGLATKLEYPLPDIA